MVVFVIHGLEGASAALQAGAEAGLPVTLVSATGAAAYGGPAWFREVVAAAAQEAGCAPAAAYLDCGDRPGDVLAAIRAGVSGVIFTGCADVAAKLAALASAQGVALLRERPPAHDLRDAPDPVGCCRAVLASAGGSA